MMYPTVSSLSRSETCRLDAYMQEMKRQSSKLKLQNRSGKLISSRYMIVCVQQLLNLVVPSRIRWPFHLLLGSSR
jgi:hypothetical protein